MAPIQDIRKNHSIEIALLSVANDIRMSVDSGSVTVLIFNFAVDYITNNILSYLVGKGGVFKASCSSSTALISCRVPQGSVHGPILSSLFLFPRWPHFESILRSEKLLKTHQYRHVLNIFMSFQMFNVVS